jgi:3-oxoacyl-[acyl-carrier protein] reductase
MLLAGKNTLVTGASRGIGAAVMDAFAAEGANVWAFARTPDAAFEERCAALAQKHGVWIKPLYADLRNEAAVKAAVQAAMADRLPLHALVNNAGVMGADKVFQLTSTAEMRELFEADFFGVIALSQLAARWMARKREGRSSTSRRSPAGRGQPPGLLRRQGRAESPPPKRWRGSWPV